MLNLGPWRRCSLFELVFTPPPVRSWVAPACMVVYRGAGEQGGFVEEVEVEKDVVYVYVCFFYVGRG